MRVEEAMKIRELRKDESRLLEDFLYEAIFIPEGMAPPDRAIVKWPELRVIPWQEQEINIQIFTG